MKAPVSSASEPILQRGREKLWHLLSKQSSPPSLCVKLWSSFSRLLFNLPTAVQINSQADSWFLVEVYPWWGQVQVNWLRVKRSCPTLTLSLKLSLWAPAWWPWSVSWTRFLPLGLRNTIQGYFPVIRDPDPLALPKMVDSLRLRGSSCLWYEHTVTKTAP